jgi:cell division protease FtsH
MEQRPDSEPRVSRMTRLFWIAVALGFVAILSWGGRDAAPTTVDYSGFLDLIEQDQVERVVLKGDKAHVTFRQEREIAGKLSTRADVHIPAQDETMLPKLREHGVAVAADPSQPSIFPEFLWLVLPWVLILGAWLWISRRASKMAGMGMGGMGPLGGPRWKPTRRVEAQENVGTRMTDVAGAEGAKRDLAEVVAFLREPERFAALGGKMPRGVLLIGPPGTGKTLIARAVAGEAGVAFFSLTGSEFIEMFVGVGAARVRELFAEARKAAPAIIFIDEIDAVGRSRGTGLGGGHDEREQTLNQLLAEMDGFDRTEQVVVMAATNRPDVLDPALLRPGRFDRRVVVDLPSHDARLAILKVHVRNKPLAADVDLAETARATPGFSGADLAAVANEAALAAFRRESQEITARDFEEALDKVQLGNPRETHLTIDEKKRIAIHEAGHTLVAAVTPGAVAPSRVSILPRGMALGVTQQRPPTDRHLYTKSELEARLRVLMGGYAAERAWLGEASTGAENDLEQAGKLALRMVSQLGMSDTIGPVFHEQSREHPFLGARIATDGGPSDATAHSLEKEAQRLLKLAEAAAEQTIAAHGPAMKALVDALLAHETLDGAALEAALAATRAAPAAA